MAENNIELKSINDLLGMNFFIPSYQRGYRWKKQQVTDLLEDIKDFIENKKSDGFYCIQPLVVRELKEDTFTKIKDEAKTLEEVKNLLKGRWEVIDGQQRLTTIYILLACLSETKPYSIEYETRGNSASFLQKIAKTSSDEKDNIDYYHMIQAKKTIDKWFENKSDEEKTKFKTTLLNDVKFIWYESVNEDPIKVFTRLNIGKISLTNAELIKALFLNSSNFPESDFQKIRLKQQEIASEWDRIEYTLQNDEFWLFIHDTDYSNPTRIDFIFDLICEQKKLGDFEGKIGTDKYRTFRYFYEYFKFQKEKINEDTIENCWQKVKTVFKTFEEWYNDLELYHYVGYLVDQGEKIYSLLELWNEQKNTKDNFVKILKEKIKGKINNKCKNLDTQYGESGESKRDCYPLLLLLNIQTVINQNNELVKNEKYGLGAFYKFPFHLFKKEGHKKNGKGWEVEHIASNSGDDLENTENKKMYLAAIEYCLPAGKLKDDVKNFLDGQQVKNEENRFTDLYDEVKKLDLNPLEGNDKQKIWNYALLDSSTNEEYQNDPFPIKRICVLTKEDGHKAKVNYGEKTHRITIDKKESAIAFIPPCTKNVFTKAYTDIPKALNSWTKEDAEAYKQIIYETLKEFDVKIGD